MQIYKIYSCFYNVGYNEWQVPKFGGLRVGGSGWGDGAVLGGADAARELGEGASKLDCRG